MINAFGHFGYEFTPVSPCLLVSWCVGWTGKAVWCQDPALLSFHYVKHYSTGVLSLLSDSLLQRPQSVCKHTGREKEWEHSIIHYGLYTKSHTVHYGLYTKSHTVHYFEILAAVLFGALCRIESLWSWAATYTLNETIFIIFHCKFSHSKVRELKREKHWGILIVIPQTPKVSLVMSFCEMLLSMSTTS